MRALIFVAHGSRRQEANNEVFALVDAISSRLEESYDAIQVAFLELTQPSLTEALRGVIDHGAETITVYPYFLNSGNHVEADIPRILEEFETSHPDITFRLTAHFGGCDRVRDLVVAQLSGDAQV